MGRIEVIYPDIQAVCTTKDFGRTFEPASYLPAPTPCIDGFLALGSFRRLTSVSLYNVHFDSSFLPLLIGPGSPERQQLERFEISHCRPGPPESEMALAFVLDIIPWILPCDYYDDDCELEMEQHIDAAFGGEPQLSLQPVNWRERHRRTLELARVDWDTFRAAWHELWTISVDHYDLNFCTFPRYFPFTALHTMTLPLYIFEYLFCVLLSSSFPSLRYLTYESWGEPVEILNRMWLDLYIPTMRYSITRPSRRGEHPEQTPPLSRPAPLRRRDQVAAAFGRFTWYDEYRGPQLDLLDLSGVEFAYPSDEED
ncbi:hypothetical protein JCM10207_005550 [Rhodosporidiobolus poonsookiae]